MKAIFKKQMYTYVSLKYNSDMNKVGVDIDLITISKRLVFYAS